MGKSAFNIKVDPRAFSLGFAIFALGLLIRLVGINWGLPNAQRYTSLHPDEPVILAVAQHVRPLQGQLTPNFYNYGTFYLSVLSVATDVVKGYQGQSEEKPSAETIARVTASEHMAGRVVSALAGAAIGWVVVILLLPFAGRIGAGAGGLACAVAPGLVVHSRFQTVDVLAVFLATASLLWAVRIANSEQNSLRWVAYASVLAGLSGGTKYTGLLLVVPILAAIAVGFRQQPERLAKAVGVAVVGIAASFLIATPGAILQTDAFMRDFKYEALHTSQGHGLTFVGTSPGFAYHLSNLADSTSLLFTVLGIGGLAYAAYRQEKWVLAVAVFGLLYYILIGRAEVKFLRYVLPLVPVVACGFGYLVTQFHRSGGFARYVNVFSIFALTGIGGGGLFQTILFTQWMAQPDLRDSIGADLVAKGGSVGIPEDAWFWTPTLYPQVAVPRGVPFSRRFEAQSAAPIKVLQVVDGEARPQWDTRLIEQLRPDRITFSSFEYDDPERISHMSPVPAEDKPMVDQFVLFMKTLNRDYQLETVVGLEGPKVHDLMYIRPTVWVWKRKTN